MHVLIGIALKSLLIAGLTLGLLELLKRRSAAERSWVAHIGLLALVIMAFAPLVLPTWNVEAPALLASSPDPAPIAKIPAQPSLPVATNPIAVEPAKTIAATSAPALPTLSPLAALTALYAVPAAILLLITFLALARLVALQARADVLVDGHWLSALARAQRRMGFKHGTALLTSNELVSPISWGLMRPVILLNSRAVEAADEAEAIIAHELAHVARMDWVKLLLARVATALFWFNPLVWVLAREAHQLREEAADDTVLAADIVATDYAQLLVGVARHECPGLLLGAHGVAPSKSSLARRVARVLDGKSVRGPAARSFALGVFVGAVLVAAPLAALTLTPAAPKTAKLAAAANTPAGKPVGPYYPAIAGAPEGPTDLGHIIATGVSTGVSTAVAAATAIAPDVVSPSSGDFHAVGRNGATVDGVNGTIIARAPNGATSTIYAPDAQGRRKIVARAPNGVTSVTFVDARDVPEGIKRAERERNLDKRDIDSVIEMRAAGITADYVNAMRAVSPSLRALDPPEFTGMKSVGVTPEFARELVAAGFRNINADDLTQAKAIGVTGEYARGLAAAGMPPDMDEYVELRAVGVPVSYVAGIRKSGRRVGADQLVQMWAVGVRANDLNAYPAPPRPPKPPRKGRDQTDPDSDPDG